jgi:hypothetical protein
MLAVRARAADSCRRLHGGSPAVAPVGASAAETAYARTATERWGQGNDPMWPWATLTVHRSLMVCEHRAVHLGRLVGMVGSNQRLLPCEGSADPTRTYAALRVAPQRRSSTVMADCGNTGLCMAEGGSVSGKSLARPASSSMARTPAASSRSPATTDWHLRCSALLRKNGAKVLRKVMRHRRVRKCWARSGDLTADVACGAASLLQVQVEGAVL